MSKQTKTTVLWLMTMGGFAFHSLMDLLPLFWSQGVAISNDGTAPAPMLLMMATLSMLLPVCGLFCLMAGRRWALVTNVVLALVIALFNIVHAFLELPSDNAAQYIVMPLMIVIGLLLAWQSFALLRKAE